jgi:hypothetical protein
MKIKSVDTHEGAISGYAKGQSAKERTTHKSCICEQLKEIKKNRIP